MNAKSDESIVARARECSVRAHTGQTRDNGQPYATHPAAVADILRRHGVTDAATLAAAYLHDVLEDTDIKEPELAAEFGPEITGLVVELTNRGAPGRTFEQKHAALADHARHMSAKAKWVKLADRLHNLSEMTVWKPEKQQRYARVTFDLLAALRPWPSEALANEVRQLADSFAQ